MDQSEILKGTSIRLVALDAEQLSAAYSHWLRDSEFSRLMDSGVSQLHSANKIKEWFEKELKDNPFFYYFMIRTLNTDELIGDIGLGGSNWNHQCLNRAGRRWDPVYTGITRDEWQHTIT